MTNLFLAISFPELIKKKLIEIRPRRVLGIRPIEDNQIHLTLHFLGNNDSERICAALKDLSFAEFPLTIEGVGEFAARDGSRVIWAGIRPSPELMNLHSMIGEALINLGITLESRPYSPHITLARCQPETPFDAVKRFLSKHESFLLTDIPISEFRLYSSVAVPRGREYRNVMSFPLIVKSTITVESSLFNNEHHE